MLPLCTGLAIGKTREKRSEFLEADIALEGTRLEDEVETLVSGGRPSLRNRG